MATQVRAGGTAAGERRFYGGMGIVILLLVLAGFAPSYFLRGWIDVGRPLPEMSALIHVHAVVFSAWIGLFIAQTALISSRRHALHKRLGGVMIALAAAMVVMGVLVAMAQVARGAAARRGSRRSPGSRCPCSIWRPSPGWSARAISSGATRRRTRG